MNSTQNPIQPELIDRRRFINTAAKHSPARHSPARIEPLEARIAPAAVFTFTDVDGDDVTVSTSKGTNADLAAILDRSISVLGEELQRIDFSGNADVFAGTNLTVTATPTALGGDGLVNVGFIDATALDLGRIVIRGDLGRIDAGDAALGTAAVKGLTVNSMGLFGTTTQEAGGDLVSNLDGSLGFLKVAGSVNGARLDCDGCGAVTIGGSLRGGSSNGSGAIYSSGAMGPVKIGGDIEGGTGNSSGRISAGGTLASVTVGGSLLGGGGNSSCTIEAIALGPVKIAGRVEGGDGSNSAHIFSSSGAFQSVTIGGSLIGGAGARSGWILSYGTMGAVKVGGSIFGGGGDQSGRIQSSGTLGAVTLGGSLVGGAGDDSGSIESDGAMGAVKIAGSIFGGGGDRSGRIYSGGTLGAVTLGGSLVGGSANETGRIGSVGAMGVVKIGGNLEGGGGAECGYVYCDSRIAGVNVAGSIIGGSGAYSGTVLAITGLGTVKIGGDLVGGTDIVTGSVACGLFMEANAAGVTIGGSIFGGTDGFSGSIIVTGALGPVKIGGNLEGGSVNAAVVLQDTGVIRAQRVASLTIGGSIVAGVEGGGGTLFNSGAVRAEDDLGPVVVKGSLVGNDTNHVLITGRGQAKPGVGTDVAIARLTVEGRVEYADILAGYNASNTPVAVNADAQIGAVVVGDWIASNLVAGVQDDADAALDDTFGEGDDQLVVGGTATIARIASILIKGTALDILGNPANFGIIAQQIGSLKIGPTVIPLTPGPGNDLADLLIGIGGDLHVREV